MPTVAQTPTEQPDSPGILSRLAERARYFKDFCSSDDTLFLSFCNTSLFLFASGKPELDFRLLGRRRSASLVLIMRITSSLWLTVMWSGPPMSEVPCRRGFRRQWKITCHSGIDQPRLTHFSQKVNISIQIKMLQLLVSWCLLLIKCDKIKKNRSKMSLASSLNLTVKHLEIKRGARKGRTI